MIAVLCGCGGTEPATQVTVRTNAPPGLFDRISIEVRRDGESEACAGCRRDVSARELEAGATFSIVAGAAPPVVHVTLFRERGQPARRASAIELYGTYPDSRAATVEVRLPWQAVGVVQGSWEAPVDVTALPAFAPDAPRACTALVGDDEACVPGGLFWFGDPMLDLFAGVDREGNDERLVELSPFALDRQEVTIGQLRAASFPFTPQCARFPDDVAAACVLWTTARDYCELLGKRLPTEAELEYVMGGLTSQRYAWGDGTPECADAVYGGCGHVKPSAPGSAPRDRLTIGSAVVVDLVGNVAEWSSDVWNSTREPCFAEPVLRNPRCDVTAPSTKSRRPFKGGGWDLEALYLGAAMRAGIRESLRSSDVVGFRCARSLTP